MVYPSLPSVVLPLSDSLKVIESTRLVWPAIVTLPEASRGPYSPARVCALTTSTPCPLPMPCKVNTGLRMGTVSVRESSSPTVSVAFFSTWKVGTPPVTALGSPLSGSTMPSGFSGFVMYVWMVPLNGFFEAGMNRLAVTVYVPGAYLPTSTFVWGLFAS